MALRGVDLTDVRRRALDRLNEHNISTTLVVTLKKGLNDDEIGAIIDFALKQPCVRGVTFQPIQVGRPAGRFRPRHATASRSAKSASRSSSSRPSSSRRTSSPSPAIPIAWRWRTP